jgi:hypothetical protein
VNAGEPRCVLAASIISERPRSSGASPCRSSRLSTTRRSSRRHPDSGTLPTAQVPGRRVIDRLHRVIVRDGAQHVHLKLTQRHPRKPPNRMRMGCVTLRVLQRAATFPISIAQKSNDFDGVRRIVISRSSVHVRAPAPDFLAIPAPSPVGRAHQDQLRAKLRANHAKSRVPP